MRHGLHGSEWQDHDLLLAEVHPLLMLISLAESAYCSDCTVHIGCHVQVRFLDICAPDMERGGTVCNYVYHVHGYLIPKRYTII